MKILTKQSNSCPYLVKQLPGMDQGWSIIHISRDGDR